jgi:hypothetical protein
MMMSDQKKPKSDYSFTAHCIAPACHEANRLIQFVVGEEVSPPWPDAPDWQRNSALAGVTAMMANPGRTPEQSHEGWLAHKQAEGWVYGPVKDAEKKEHPCMVPYSELPPSQRVKDWVFTTITRTILTGMDNAADQA